MTDSRIGEMKLYGDFSSVRFYDARGLVQKVTLLSDQPNAAFSHDSMFGGVKSLTISEDWLYGVNSFEYPSLNEIIVKEGVSEASLDMDIFSPEIDIYLPSSLQRLRLPGFNYPDNIRDDKAAMEAYRIKHRVHLDWISKETFEEMRLYQDWGVSYNATESDFSMNTCDLGGYLPVFGENSANLEELKNFPYSNVLEDGTIELTGYCGKGSVIDVPSIYRGKTVSKFQLTNDIFSYENLHVEGVTELRLPATLTELRIRNSPYSGEPTYSFDRVVYAGTKVQLKNIFAETDTEYNLLQATKVVECSDGIFAQGSSHYDYEIITYQDALGSTLTVQVDWKGLLGELGHGGQPVVFANYTYQGMTFMGHAIGRLQLQNEQCRLSIDIINTDRVDITFFNGQEYLDNFIKQSVEESSQPIAHKTQTRVHEPSCWEQGYTETYCTECNAVISRTDMKPSLKHELTGEPTISTPTCTRDGHTTQRCSLCGGDVVVEGSEIAALGHLFDESGHCTRDNCLGLKGDGVETIYTLEAPTGEILTLHVSWQGYSTENGDFRATVMAKFEYGGLIFDGEGMDVYRVEKDGNYLDVTAKGGEVFATFQPKDGEWFEFKLIS